MNSPEDIRSYIKSIDSEELAYLFTHVLAPDYSQRDVNRLRKIIAGRTLRQRLSATWQKGIQA